MPYTSLPLRAAGRLNYWSAAALLAAGLCISSHSSCARADTTDAPAWYLAPCATASYHWDRERNYNERHCGVGITRRAAQPAWYAPDAYSVDWLRKNSLGTDSIYALATWEPRKLQLRSGALSAGFAVHAGFASGYHVPIAGAVIPGLWLQYGPLRLDWTAWPDPTALGAKKDPGKGNGSGTAIRLSIQLPL